MDTPPSPTTNDGPFLLPNHLRCTYRSKACPNERARKRNGTVHKLCQEHRVKANINQRNMQKRLRVRRQLELACGALVMQPLAFDSAATSAVASALTMAVSYEGMLMDSEDDEWSTCDLEPLCTPCELMPEDLEALLLLWDQRVDSSAPSSPTPAVDVDVDMETETAAPTSELASAFVAGYADSTSATHQFTDCAVF